MINRIIEELEKPKNLRSITIGPIENKGRLTIHLLQEDLDRLKLALQITDLIERIPINDWIKTAVSEYVRLKV